MRVPTELNWLGTQSPERDNEPGSSIVNGTLLYQLNKYNRLLKMDNTACNSCYFDTLHHKGITHISLNKLTRNPHSPILTEVVGRHQNTGLFSYKHCTNHRTNKIRFSFHHVSYKSDVNEQSQVKRRRVSQRPPQVTMLEPGSLVLPVPVDNHANHSVS